MNRNVGEKPGMKPVTWWTWVVWLLTLAVGLIFYPHLPNVVATHFNASGEPNGYMPRLQAVLVLPGVTLGIILLWHVIWRIDPKRTQYPKFWPTYRLLGGLIVVFLGLIQVWTLAHALHLVGASSRVMFTLIGVLILILSNWLPRVRQNWAIGIRTPWTLSSEACWRRTHQLAGQLGVASGLLDIIFAWVLPAAWAGTAVVLVILAWVLVAVVASYAFYVRR